MRVIKFRAWDKEKKQMLPVCDISFGDDGRALTVIFQTAPKEKYYRGLVDGENGILMQFTGLKDKHGQDIYEGDIVKCLDGYSATVSYNEQHAEFEPFGSGEGVEWGDGVEVIGNIYEPKEE